MVIHQKIHPQAVDTPIISGIFSPSLAEERRADVVEQYRL
jgi:hypothetical protein